MLPICFRRRPNVPGAANDSIKTIAWMSIWLATVERNHMRTVWSVIWSLRLAAPDDKVTQATLDMVLASMLLWICSSSVIFSHQKRIFKACPQCGVQCGFLNCFQKTFYICIVCILRASLHYSKTHGSSRLKFQKNICHKVYNVCVCKAFPRYDAQCGPSDHIFSLFLITLVTIFLLCIFKSFPELILYTFFLDLKSFPQLCFLSTVAKLVYLEDMCHNVQNVFNCKT